MNFQMEKYLKPTSTIDCENKSVKEKARDLTKGQEDVIEKAKSLFYFVRDEIKYSPYSPRYLAEHFRASNILSEGMGYCVQKAVLLVALARAAGIPARLRFAEIRNNLIPEEMLKWRGTDVFNFHGYSELYIEGKWVKATPAFDLRTCEEHRLIPVEFDGENDALLPSHNQDGKVHIEYLMDFGHYQDVPLNEIWEKMIQAYGTVYIKPPKR